MRIESYPFTQNCIVGIQNAVFKYNQIMFKNGFYWPGCKKNEAALVM